MDKWKNGKQTDYIRKCFISWAPRHYLIWKCLGLLIMGNYSKWKIVDDRNYLIETTLNETYSILRDIVHVLNKTKTHLSTCFKAYHQTQWFTHDSHPPLYEAMVSSLRSRSRKFRQVLLYFRPRIYQWKQKW